jgi:hypothetical protein
MDNISTLAGEILGVIAADLATAWVTNAGKTTDTLKTFSASVNRVLAAQVAKLLELLASARSQLDQTLHLAHQVLPAAKDSSEPLPMPSGAPIADLTMLTQGLVLKRPTFLSSLGAGLVRRHIRQPLQAQLDQSLPEYLSRYRAQLREWFRRSLAELREGFAARAGVYRAQFEQSQLSAPAGFASDEESLKKDIALLENWGKAVEPVPARMPE